MDKPAAASFSPEYARWNAIGYQVDTLFAQLSGTQRKTKRRETVLPKCAPPVPLSPLEMNSRENEFRLAEERETTDQGFTERIAQGVLELFARESPTFRRLPLDTPLFLKPVPVAPALLMHSAKYQRTLICMIRSGSQRPLYVMEMSAYLMAFDRYLKARKEDCSLGLILQRGNDAHADYVFQDPSESSGVRLCMSSSSVPVNLRHFLPPPEKLKELIPVPRRESVHETAQRLRESYLKKKSLMRSAGRRALRRA